MLKPHQAIWYQYMGTPTWEGNPSASKLPHSLHKFDHPWGTPSTPLLPKSADIGPLYWALLPNLYVYPKLKQKSQLCNINILSCINQTYCFNRSLFVQSIDNEDKWHTDISRQIALFFHRFHKAQKSMGLIPWPPSGDPATWQNCDLCTGQQCSRHRIPLGHQIQLRCPAGTR